VALTGPADGPPVVPPGRAATVAAELADRFAAATGVQVDGAQILAERAAFTGYRRRGAVSAGGACRLLPSADGWVAVSCARPDDPALLGALVGEEAGDDPWPALTRWLRAHTGAELSQRAELLSIAAAPVTPLSLTTSPTSLTPITSIASITSAALVAPAVPLAVPSRPLAGLLVADFSALWAGPLCAHLLGLAGARVVKVETPDRPDGARSGNTAFYRLLHAGHRCVTLDPRTSHGRAEMAALVRAADVVIESSRPRALARFGLDAEGAAAAGTTWVSITAYGRASARVGFGDDVAAGAGLVARDADGRPLFVGDAIADPLTGLAAATAVACAPAGGALLDLAMSDVVAATLDPADRTQLSPAVRPDGSGWVVDTAAGAVPVAEPRKVTRARR
jgi:crotonobetainyl-CoA:carnitine CoA-transferase CaiB-like acyl-CoA transferase